MPTGKVKKVVHDRGFGFITQDGAKDVFFHRNEVRTGSFEALNGGESAEFEVQDGPKGPRAVNVRITQ